MKTQHLIWGTLALVLVAFLALALVPQTVTAAEGPLKACAKKPKDLEPANGAIVPSLEVVLKWTDTGCAESYTVKVLRVGGRKVAVKSGQVKTRYTFTNGVAGQSYDWQVRACNAGGCGPWTELQRFTIQP
jgi:hypothetical protein